jgi:hypothetical protein
MHTNCNFELGFKGGLALGCGRFVKKHHNVVCGLIEKLDHKFVSQEIMNATGITYPQFWLQLSVGIVGQQLNLIFHKVS